MLPADLYSVHVYKPMRRLISSTTWDAAPFGAEANPWWVAKMTSRMATMWGLRWREEHAGQLCKRALFQLTLRNNLRFHVCCCIESLAHRWFVDDWLKVNKDSPSYRSIKFLIFTLNENNYYEGISRSLAWVWHFDIIIWQGGLRIIIVPLSYSKIWQVVQ